MDVRRLLILALFVLGIGLAPFHRSPVVYAQTRTPPPSPEPGTWTSTGSMTTARVFHTLTLLPTGQVLAAGGSDDFNGTSKLASAELYDPTTGTWTSTNSMATARAGPSATLLADGKVLVAGGSDDDSNPIATAELYDPVTQTWTPTGNLHTARSGQGAIRLADGPVLVVGGWPHSTDYAIASAEIYDPSTGLWSPAGDLNFPRAGPVPVLLPDGQVLVVSGIYCCPYTPYTSVELFDPATNTWTLATPMSVARSTHIVVLLPSGKILVTGGGFGVCCPWELTLTAELYDPTTDTWTPTGDMVYLGSPGTWPVLLPNGNVLVAGGEDMSGGILATAQVYDTQAGTWSATGSMQTARAYHAALVLPNGNVLVTGGRDYYGSAIFDSAELYAPVQPLPSGVGNLLTNASFEFDSNGDLHPDNWTSNPAVARSQGQVRSGNYAMQHRAELDSAYTIQQSVANIQSGSPYALSGWVSVPPISDTTGFTLTLAVQWRDAAGVITGTSTLLPITQTTEGWARQASIVTAPIGAATAAVQMAASSLQGPLYVDDLFFGNLLGNAGFEQDSDGDARADGWQPNDLAVRTDVDAHGGSYALHLQGANDATYEVTSPPMFGMRTGELYHVSGAVKISAGQDAFRFDIMVEWQDASGAVISSTLVKRYTSSTDGGWSATEGSVTVPPGVSRAILRLEVTSLTGSIEVDDLAVHFDGPAPTQRVYMPLLIRQ